MADDDESRDYSAALVGAGIAALMALCCLGLPFLLSVGVAGVASLLVDSLWWLGPAAVVLALATMGARLRRTVRKAGRTRRIALGSRSDE